MDVWDQLKKQHYWHLWNRTNWLVFLSLQIRYKPVKMQTEKEAITNSQTKK